MLENKKIFILGMARSGYEVAKLLSSDNEIFITDMKEQEKDKVEELEKLGVTIKICDDPIEYLDDSFDIMVKNPGIKYTHPCVVKAKDFDTIFAHEELGTFLIQIHNGQMSISPLNQKAVEVLASADPAIRQQLEESIEEHLEDTQS